MADAVDFQLGLLTSAAAPSSPLSSARRTTETWSGTAEVSSSPGGTIRGTDGNSHIHVLSVSPLCRVGITDGEG